jgi:RHS repeat-associated protein
MLTGLNVDEYLIRSDSNGLVSHLSDALGSMIGLENSSGSLATNYSYQPFDVTTAVGTASTNPYQFTGRENDLSGLYYMRARYYSPTLQRFISQDPIGFGGGDANLYAYAMNRPSYLVDPSGLQSLPQMLDNAVIDYNENKSFSGYAADSNLVDTSHAVYNRMYESKKIGYPGTADPEATVPDPEIPVARRCMLAAERARFENKQGIDPTQGSTNFFQQSPGGPSPRWAGDPRYTLQTTDGPLHNSFPNVKVPARDGIIVKFATGP